MKKQINIDFEIVNTLLSFCGSQHGRSVSEMKNSLPLNSKRPLDEQRAVADLTVSWMIERKLIIKTRHLVRGGRKLATTWIKHPALNEQVLKKVA